MTEYDELPEDLDGFAKLQLSFARLPDDSAASCPIAINEVLDYLAREVPDGDVLEGTDLKFLRTARVEDSNFWIWGFTEPNGDDAYVTVSCDADGGICVGYEANDFEMTPEQFMLASYHGLV